MERKYDFGAMLTAATLLLLCVTYLAQCSSGSHRPQTVVAATAAVTPPAEARDEDAEQEHERKPKSIREFAAQEEKEEREKIKAISRALQTAGADPEFRKTYGFPQ